MNSSDIRSTAIALEQFDLLPPSFHYHNRVRGLLRSWLTVVFALLAVLSGVIAATIVRTHRTRQTHAQIASAAIPLMDLRRSVLQLQEQNIQRARWCKWVEATRPDDSALQTLAAIAVASQNREIIIDSLHLRLPIEFPSSETQTPEWAVPQLMITARVADPAISPWVDRLNSVDRIETAAVAEDDSPVSGNLSLASDFASVRLTATPLSTRVLP